jgi:hypothetical protein
MPGEQGDPVKSLLLRIVRLKYCNLPDAEILVKKKEIANRNVHRHRVFAAGAAVYVRLPA